VQGGFLVLKPSMQSFTELKSIIRKGDFRQGRGWGGTGHGSFYGGMTFQGIIPYYYDEIHPGTAVELNRCVYNQMCDNPRDKPTVNDIVNGKCMDGRKDCEDCRSRPLNEVRTAHFTLCQKPWSCLPHNENRIQARLCRKLIGEWYRVRESFEVRAFGKSSGQDPEISGEYQKSFFRGFCKSFGEKGYIPMNKIQTLILPDQNL